MSKRPVAIVLSSFLSLMLATGKPAASGYFIPLLYEIPEGSVGIFKSGEQLYDGVYTAGVYPVWPSDEALIVSILPEKAVIKRVPCLTTDGIDIDFGEITVAYRVLEGGVWALVNLFGGDFVSPLIEKPVQQGIADWCADMTAEEVFLEKDEQLTQHLLDYLTHYLQIAQGSQQLPGLLVTGLEISRPTVPDEVIDNVLKRTADQFAAEDGLYGSQLSPSSVADVAVIEELAEEDVRAEENSVDIVSNGVVAERKPELLHPTRNKNNENKLHPTQPSPPSFRDTVVPEVPSAEDEEPSDEDIDEEESRRSITSHGSAPKKKPGLLEPELLKTESLHSHDDEQSVQMPNGQFVTDLPGEVKTLKPAETNRVTIHERPWGLTGGKADSVVVEQSQAMDADAVQLDLELSEEDAEHDPVFIEEQSRARLQKPLSTSLWKNNSSRLYIGW